MRPGKLGPSILNPLILMNSGMLHKFLLIDPSLLLSSEMHKCIINYTTHTARQASNSLLSFKHTINRNI